MRRLKRNVSNLYAPPVLIAVGVEKSADPRVLELKMFALLRRGGEPATAVHAEGLGGCANRPGSARTRW